MDIDSASILLLVSFLQNFYKVLFLCFLKGVLKVVLHLCFLKGVLGVKRSTPNWAVLRECGQGPLQFYWFRAAAKFFSSLQE